MGGGGKEALFQGSSEMFALGVISFSSDESEDNSVDSASSRSTMEGAE